MDWILVDSPMWTNLMYSNLVGFYPMNLFYYFFFFVCVVVVAALWRALCSPNLYLTFFCFYFMGFPIFSPLEDEFV